MKTIGWFVVLSCMLVGHVRSQGSELSQKLVVPDSLHVQILTLKDGTVLNGAIVDVTPDAVLFKTELGELSIAIHRIKDVKLISTTMIRGGEYWFPNPNGTRLFFAPTGRMLKAGDGYFQDIYVFFIGGAYGITDFITIGGGTSIFPGSDQIFYFTPKLGVEVASDVHLAVGTLFIGSTDSEQNVGIHYAVGSYGSPEGSLTLGIGYGYSGNNVSSKPIFVVGGERRLTRRFAGVTENWLIPDSDAPLASFGFRFMGESMAVDLGIWRPLKSSGDLGLGIPYVDFVVNIR